VDVEALAAQAMLDHPAQGCVVIDDQDGLGHDDCVDTVGFPAPGQRWICEAGKCVRGKMPSMVPESSATACEEPAQSEKATPSAGKAKKWRR
jgi:hypothetical protein